MLELVGQPLNLEAPHLPLDAQISRTNDRTICMPQIYSSFKFRSRGGTPLG